MRIASLLLLFVIAACSETKQELNKNFDTRAYFKAEAERLSTARKRVIKNLVFNGSTQTVTLTDTIDVNKELAPFLEIDLGNDAYAGSFKVDTLKEDDIRKIVYTCLDEKMELKKAEIMFQNDKVTGINYEMQNKNSLYSNHTLLSYEPETGYKISGAQKVNLLNESDYLIEARWAD